MNYYQNRMKTKKEELHTFVKSLVSEGYKIAIPQNKEHNLIWVFIENKHGQICNISNSGYDGFNYSTEHKPTKGEGSGYSIHRNKGLSRELVDTSFNSPRWGKQVEKWKSLEELVNSKNSHLDYDILS